MQQPASRFVKAPVAFRFEVNVLLLKKPPRRRQAANLPVERILLKLHLFLSYHLNSRVSMTLWTLCNLFTKSCVAVISKGALKETPFHKL